MERISFNEIPKEIVMNLMGIENYINNSNLDFQLLELIRLRVAQINGCSYCIDMHFKELKHINETDLRLSLLSVWEETNIFTEKEKAVLFFSESITKLTNKSIDRSVYDRMENHFSKKEIILLTLAVAQINTWTRLMKTFQIEAGKYQVNN
jgi:AhpD family alkylhydroperoxidase